MRHNGFAARLAGATSAIAAVAAVLAGTTAAMADAAPARRAAKPLCLMGKVLLSSLFFPPL